MKAQRHTARRAISILGLIALLVSTMQMVVAPAASRGAAVLRRLHRRQPLQLDRHPAHDRQRRSAAPAAPSARAEVTNQSAFAYRDLGATFNQVCMSANVNRLLDSGVDLFRLRTAANGGIIKAFRAANGTVQMRSDFGIRRSARTVQLGTGWHNMELCGTVGSNTTWDLYRDGVRDRERRGSANTGTTPVGRIQIGDTAAKTFTVNFDHVVLDEAPGDGGAPGDTTPPRPSPADPPARARSSSSIQISWAASTDPSLRSPTASTETVAPPRSARPPTPRSPTRGSSPVRATPTPSQAVDTA